MSAVEQGLAADGRRMRQREYGGVRHRTLRKTWAPAVEAGLVDCAICGHRIAPGSPWDLAHAEDRRFYLGPTHAAHNRATAGSGLDPVGSRSREW